MPMPENRINTRFFGCRFSHLFAKLWFNEEMKRIVSNWQTICPKRLFLADADVGGDSATRCLRRVNPSTNENGKNGYITILE